jgi:signal transduction histidine kinase/ActR/RegA family two-component response regulator
VEVRTESFLQRVLRYAGVAVLVALAAFVVIAVGLAHQALTKANAELEANATALRNEIAERRKTEEALLQSRKMEAIGQLTGGIAHDFNNLLMVVISGLRMLDRHADPERRARTIEAMRQAAERGAVLMRQLLAFSRRQTLELETIDIGSQLKAMRPLLERSLRADILVEISVPSDLGPVKTDATQLELAVLNLALNARDAMPRGGVLTISAENVADQVEVAVRDTGVGIAPEIIERVLEPYFTTKQAGQGTGLGLSQVYGFMRQCGGDLRIDSVVNAGTRVTLSFPRSAEPVKQAAAITSGAIEGHAPHARILLVEDEDNVAEMIGAMLQQMGHQATRVADAKSALEALAASRAYDLILSDIIMPGDMNGVDLAREVRGRRPDLPVVLMSGYSGQQTAAPDFPMLRKPFHAEDLDRALGAALGERKVHKLA